MDKRRRCSRRSLLRGLGAAGVVLPLFPSLDLWANPPGTPKRLILFYTPNGVATKTWFPKGTETNFQFQLYGGLQAGKDKHPLEALKKKLIVLENVGMEELSRLKVAGDNHKKGTGQLFTGESLAYRDGKLWASHQSIDQHVADYFVANKKAGRFRSIEAGVFNVVNEVGGRISYRKGGVPISPQADPYQLHSKLFASRLMDPQKLKALLAQRKSILDGARSDLQMLKNRLNAGDKNRLEQHLTSIREIERQLSVPIPASCVPPTLKKGDMNPIDPTHYPKLAQAQIKLIAMAMKCDLTRVASIMWDQSGGKIKFKWLNLGVTAEHHTIGHGGQDSSHYGPALRKIDLWYCQQFAALCQELDSAKEGTGTVLDNSLVVWGSELGDGRFHKHDNMPFLLAGGAGHFKMGRYLKYDPAKKVAHNHLLVSICHAMGDTGVTTFGNPKFKGPLPRL